MDSCPELWSCEHVSRYLRLLVRPLLYHGLCLLNSIKPTVYAEQVPPVRNLHTETFLDLFEVKVVFTTQTSEALVAFRIEVEGDRSCYRLQAALLARV